jgi:hypothetical protein
MRILWSHVRGTEAAPTKVERHTRTIPQGRAGTASKLVVVWWGACALPCQRT